MTDHVLIHYCAGIENIGELARDRKPIEISELLGAFKAVMIEAIEEEQGFFSTALADQLTGHWGGIPSQTPRESAVHACRAALNQLKAVAAEPNLARAGLKLNIGIADDPDVSLALVKLCKANDSSILVARPARELCAEVFPFQEVKTAEGTAFRLK